MANTDPNLAATLTSSTSPRAIDIGPPAITLIEMLPLLFGVSANGANLTPLEDTVRAEMNPQSLAQTVQDVLDMLDEDMESWEETEAQGGPALQNARQYT